MPSQSLILLVLKELEEWSFTGDQQKVKQTQPQQKKENRSLVLLAMETIDAYQVKV